MALSDSLAAVFEADAAEAVARRRDDTQLALARQRDAAAYDTRMLGGFMTTALFSSDDVQALSSMFAGLNGAIRVPSTVDHPNAVVGKP